MPKEKIQFASTLPAAEAAQYLESLAKGLREKTMLVESGDSSVAMQVPDEVKVDLEVSTDAEKGKTDIELSLSWRQRREEELAPPPGLTIVPGATAEAAVFGE